MIIRKNWQTRGWAMQQWHNAPGYDAYMDPYAPTDGNGNFIEWGSFDDRDQSWVFRSEDVLDSYYLDDILTEVPYDGDDACSPEPGLIYVYGPRGGFSNVKVAECEVHGDAGTVIVWLVGYED